MIGRRVLLVGCAAVGTVLLGAFPAAAAASGHIASISSAAGKLSIVFGGNDLPNGTAIGPDSVRLLVGGRALPVTVAPLTKETTGISRTAVLVIDTSGSMRGEGINGAKSAADAFLDKVPPDVRVGVVSFSATAVLRVAPTTDRNSVRSAISGLQAAGETALYDGIQLGLRALGSTGVRSLLLLSDGADTASKQATLESVTRLASSTSASIDAVAFKTSGSVGPVLDQVTSGAHGTVFQAGQASEIARAFTRVAKQVSDQLLITADVPGDLAGTSQTVAVTATAGGLALSDSAFTMVGSAAQHHGRRKTGHGPRPAKVWAGPLTSGIALYTSVGAVFLGLLVLLAVAAGARGNERKQTRVGQRLSIYTLSGRRAQEVQQESTVLGDNAIARSAVEFADRVVRRSEVGSGLARRLAAGGVPLRPAEFLLIHVGVAIGLPLLMLLLSGGDAAAAVVGLAFGIVAPLGYLSFKESRRTKAFLAQLPNTLQLLAGSLSAGYSFPQAVDAVVQEGTQPMASEFNKAMIEARLGLPIEDAMDGIAARMKSKDFGWVIMAVRIQREVGGNLAEVLTTVAATLRDRERIRRQVASLSAEGKLSAVILYALPVVFSLYLLLVRGEYIRVLYTDPIGWFLLIVMFVQLTVGFFWLRAVVRVEV